MKAAVKHIVVVGMGAWLVLFASSSSVLAQFTGGSVSASAGNPSPNPVASGLPSTVSLSAIVNSNPNPPLECILNFTPTWSWSVDGGTAGVSINQPNPSSPAATMTANFTTPGNYTVSATVTATWTDSCGDQTSASADTGPIVFKVIGVQNLQYNQPGSGYVDVPATLYVVVGDSVSFQAVPNPKIDLMFPTGWPVWSGSSGATGTGPTTSVTFNTLSTSLSDYKTVIATCGNSTATANVIVYNATPTLTPQDNFPGRDLDNYGVCEYVNLNYYTTPSGITASEVGGMHWQIASGGGMLTDYGDGTGLYQCPDVASTVDLSFFVGWRPIRVRAPEKGVVPPNAHDCTQVPNTGLWHVQNNCGCKAKIYMWAGCDKAVSFQEIEVREGRSSAAVANGLFANLNGDVHTPSADWYDLAAPQSSWYLWTGAVDTTGFESGGAPFQAGTFQWNIYMMYRKQGDTGDGEKYAECQSKKSSDAMGLATISKGTFGPVSLAAARGSDPNFTLPQPP